MFAANGSQDVGQRAACGLDSSASSRTRRSRWTRTLSSVRSAASPWAANGSRSERGTRTAALFYSLIESAKLCGVELRAYLREATLRAVRNPGTVTLARELKSSES